MSGPKPKIEATGPEFLLRAEARPEKPQHRLRTRTRSPPSSARPGCGKSTFIRTLNRMNDVVPGNARRGDDPAGRDRTSVTPDVDVVDLRRRVGHGLPEAQSRSPSPSSTTSPTACGSTACRIRDRLEEVVERTLREAALWDEVKDRLDENAFALSGGQQQRLCIARALAVEPEVILFDEPCSAIDPIATAKIEDLIHKLKERYTVVIVTHNMQQAARVSDFTAFLMLGRAHRVRRRRRRSSPRRRTR